MFAKQLSAMRARTGSRLVTLTVVFTMTLLGSVAPAVALPRVASVGVGTQTGTLTSGTAGSATYVVTVTKGNNSSLTADLTVTGLPAGGTGSFSPSSLVWGGGAGSPQTSTLTLSTTAATPAGAPTFTVTATRNGVSSDNASGTGTLNVQTATQVSQTITFGSLAAKTFGDADFTVSATASSGLPVSFAATGSCTVGGTLVHPTGAGSCTITASQAGNASYFPAPDVLQTFAIAQAGQTITFSALADKAVGDPDFTVSATASSGLTVSFAATGDCTVAGDLVSLTGTGSCTITASQAGDSNYTAAADVSQTFSIAAGTPTITFDAAPLVGFPGADFTVVAITNSDGALTYSFVSGPCTLVDANAGTFSPTGVGECVVQADTAATTNFAAASEQQQITITPPIIDLYAVAGTTSLAGETVTVWSYSSANAPATQPGGPTLVVDQGDTVTIALHNELSETTALLFQGQEMIPDTVGAAAGGTKVYTFTASEPGTYLYEAGLVPGAQYQVAMGLHGALIVRPTTAGQAYNDVDTAFDEEAVLVLSEIDPALNNSASPAEFDMRHYAPKYFLINGQAFPDIAEIATAAGDKVLLRYVNAGNQYHSMALLGAHQTVIAFDGSPLNFSRRFVAETFGPGQTTDAIATIPSAAADGAKFAVYDGSLLLHNSNAVGFGGMLTFLTVSGTPPTGDATGPITSTITYTPGELTALVVDTNTGGSNIAAAEYFVDATGSVGTGTAMAAQDGTFDTDSETVTYPLTLSAGSHTIYVRGQDSEGNWGALAGKVIVGADATGPLTTFPTLVANPSNGTTDVALHATGDDSTTGNSNIVAAEYFIGADPGVGTATAMAVNAAAPIASLDAVIPAATVAGLTEGPNTVSLRSQDAATNWGAVKTIDLIVDKTGPATTSVVATPTPNNGTLGFNSTIPAVRVTATATDTLSIIKAAEGFIDVVGANGAGFQFSASDGVFNSATEAVFADVPLTTVVALSNGSHTIYVHSKDGAGNWGTTSVGTLVVDKTRPTVSSVTATPNPTNTGNGNNTSFVLTAGSSDVGTGDSNIIRAEWYEGTDPGAGNGVAMTAADGSFNSSTESLTATIDFVALGWAAGNRTIYVRARDAAGNWSLTASTVVTIVKPNNIFSDSFASGTTAAWGSVTGANVSVTAAASLNGTPAFGMAVLLAGNTPGYLTDLTPVAEVGYHARFYFNPNGTTTGNNLATGYTILSGLDAANASNFQVEYRRQNQAGGTYQVRLVVTRAGGTTATNWYNVTDGSANAIEVSWASGTSTSATLYTGGIARQTLTGLNTSANLLESVRLGPSAGSTGAANGTMRFDAFVSTRNTVIGP